MESEYKNSSIKSYGYDTASRVVDSFLKRLNTTGNKKELMEIMDELNFFFVAMRKDNPDLYQAFAIDRKMLNEMIIKKITGQEIILG